MTVNRVAGLCPRSEVREVRLSSRQHEQLGDSDRQSPTVELHHDRGTKGSPSLIPSFNAHFHSSGSLPASLKCKHLAAKEANGDQKSSKLELKEIKPSTSQLQRQVIFILFVTFYLD